MMDMDIIIYQPFVNEIKELIQKKQFQAIKMVNTETINLYWEIGEEIYRQQREKGWGKSIVQILAKELQKEYNKLQSGEYGSVSVVQFAKLQGIAVSTFYKYVGILNKGGNI